MRRALLLTILIWPIVSLAAENKTVCVVAIREDITHNTLFLLRRAIREASAKNAAALVLDMDTNGGRVDVTEDIIRLLEHAPMKTYTFVDAKAYSAGAFIACATDQIYMAPGSVIGAATPVMLVPGAGVADLPKSYQEKINSAMRALIRATAQQKGHNPDVFEAMVDSDKEVVIEGQTINPKGKLLTLTSEEAARAYGKPPRSLLSAGTAKSLDELFEKAGLPNATVLRVSPFGFELLARWITMISPLLILVGFLALYVELSHPGVALPALAAIVCFGIYFFGYLAAGLAGWEAVALFVVGVALLALEIFVIPGFGITGVFGIGAIVVALVMAMVETAPGGPRIPTWSQLQVPVVKLAIGVGGATVAAMVLGRYLPKSTLFKKMELSAATSAAEGYTTASGSAKTLLGTSGVAETMLRPSGKGRFGEQLVDVVTEGDLIERGTPITIVKVEGSRVVVTRASA